MSGSSQQSENTLQQDKFLTTKSENDSKEDNCTIVSDNDTTAQLQKIVIRGRTYLLVPEHMAATHHISNSAVLQEEIRLCHEYLWSRYGSKDKYPPFHPAAVREVCQQSGAKTIFHTMLSLVKDIHPKKRQMKIKLLPSFIFSCLDSHKR